jgi:hypothetical protein
MLIDHSTLQRSNMVTKSGQQLNLPDGTAAQTLETDIPQSISLSDERSFTTYTYGTEHALQTYDVWFPSQAPPPPGEGIWIMYDATSNPSESLS